MSMALCVVYCTQIFCAECAGYVINLTYLDNKPGRVCHSCCTKLKGGEGGEGGCGEGGGGGCGEGGGGGCGEGGGWV